MTSFKHSLPEENGRPAIERLRRTEAYRLADAYNIPYKPGCKKDEIIPLLRSAERNGVFNQQPEDPEMLLPPGQRTQKKAEAKPDAYVKWRGPHDKFCVMVGDSVVKTGYESKEVAQAELDAI